MESYQERAERERKEREITYASMSTRDKVKYRNLETQYEIESQTGGPVGEDKDAWIKARMYGKRD